MSNKQNDTYNENKNEIDKCDYCHKTISFREWRYSNDLFSKPLCVNCQMDERKKTYPPKLAEFLNIQVKKTKASLGNYEKTES